MMKKLSDRNKLSPQQTLKMPENKRDAYMVVSRQFSFHRLDLKLAIAFLSKKYPLKKILSENTLEYAHPVNL